MAAKPPIRILIINPNSNSAMTHALRAPIESLDYNNTAYQYLTGPSPAPYSINNATDAKTSANLFLTNYAIVNQITPRGENGFAIDPTPDAILIACFSLHPLVPQLAHRYRGRAVVTGIFEASIQAALSLLVCCPETETPEKASRGSSLGENSQRKGSGGPETAAGGISGIGQEKFGIITTGNAWGPLLHQAVTHDILGAGKAERVFAGVECCGIDAGDLHDGDAGSEVVERKVKDAVRRLMDKNQGQVGVVVLGCAGMAGMEEWVREVAPEGVRVVDGVKAGVGMLQGVVRGGF